MAKTQSKKKTKEQEKQKITRDEAQGILNNMLIDVDISNLQKYDNEKMTEKAENKLYGKLDKESDEKSDEKSSEELNARLDEDEIGRRYQIVIDFEAQDENYDYKSALADISGIIKRKGYVKKADIDTKRNQKIPQKPDTMPFLIKQVLFYIAVMCNEKLCNLATQKEIIDIMNDNGVPISHNFFSRMKTTPTQYINKEMYNQPELPIRYMGQKNRELAYAIKNLVYQAGNYDVFCDIFGGSGAATLAVDKRKDANYVYNELNVSVFNLFEVMADEERYLELIDELKCLQSYIDMGGDWLEDIDFYKEIKIYYQNKKHDKNKKEERIKDENPQDLEMGYDDIINLMKELRDMVQNNYSKEYQFVFDGETYDKKKLLNEIFPETPFSFASFCKNFRLIKEFDKVIMGQWNMDNLSGDYVDINGNRQEISYREKDKRFRQYRAYEYYAYFENLLSKNEKKISEDEKVRYAVAEIYHWSILTTGKTGISPILRMTWLDDNQKSISNEVDKFVKKDFESLITKVHNRIKGTICENEDGIMVIQKYKHGSVGGETKHNHPLFYSDSPYEATQGYESKENNVQAFSSDNMKALILALRNTEDRFIFSCRAAKGSINGSGKSDELKSGNKDIFKNVFNVFLSEFEEKGIKLWILAIEKGGTLAQLVRDNKISEIMITNFEICDIKENEKYKNTKFKVYDFYQFLDILIHNANV